MTRPNTTRLIGRAVLWISTPLLLYLAAILLYGTINDYQPKGRLTLEPLQDAAIRNLPDTGLTFAIWNLGFGGLGKESDFFYDDNHVLFSGGRMTRTPVALVKKNLDGFLGVADTLKCDFFLFQEVDRASRRRVC